MSIAEIRDHIDGVARAKKGRSDTQSPAEYLLAGSASELERLQLQSRVWEPSGRRLLERIGDGRGARVLDVGCGVLGWLRVLSEWVGPDGEVTGSDIDDAMLAAADRFVGEEGLSNVGLARDNLFASELEPDSFDLVHARYQICPLGRAHEQIEAYVRLARPGGTIVLEDPDTAPWHFNPPAPALERLIALIEEAFRRSGGDWEAGRKQLELLREFDIDGNVGAEVIALPPGHAYLRLPLQFATALEERLLSLVSADELGQLREQGEEELREPGRWGPRSRSCSAGAGASPRPETRTRSNDDEAILDHIHRRARNDSETRERRALEVASVACVGCLRGRREPHSRYGRR